MRQFFNQVIASFIGSLAGLIFLGVMGTSSLIFLLVASLSQENLPSVQNNSFLVIDLSTKIQDRKPPNSLNRSLLGDNKTLSLRQVLKVIEKAQQDPRIIGIFLDGRSSKAQGYANLAEIRRALVKFRSSGKKIIAYDVNWSEPDYYLGSVANEVVINPMGRLVINGLTSQQLFIAGTLKKYGIGVQVVRAGSYKSAVEPYIRQNFSPESRQQLQALLSDIWQDIRGKISKSREITPQQFQKITDTIGILEPEPAKSQKLVDRVAYWDQVVVKLRNITGKSNDEKNKPFRQVSLVQYADIALRESFAATKPQIAIVYAQGVIVNGEGTANSIGSDLFAQQLAKLRRNENVKAVILRINSPGGSATASEIIFREVKLLSEEKPLIVSMGNVAASGGYWIAAGGDYIFAEENTITGSIGVFGLLFNLQEIADKNGITVDSVTTGKLANLGGGIRPRNPRELAIYQKSVDQTYRLFLRKVSRSRQLSREKVAKIAQGRVWSGKAARNIGLVDKIGGLEAALQYAAKKANLGKNWTVKEYPTRKSFEAEFLGNLFQTQTSDPLTTQISKIRSQLSQFSQFNDPRQTYAYFPWLEILD
jgi:protease-4